MRQYFVRREIEGESLGFVLDTVKTVSLNWNRGEIDRHADPGLRGRVAGTGNPHVLDFNYFAKLGQRTGDVACSLSDYNTFRNESQNYIAATYSCGAQFEHAAATLYIMVMRERDNMPWRVGYFDVVSPLLNPPPAKAEKH